MHLDKKLVKSPQLVSLMIQITGVCDSIMPGAQLGVFQGSGGFSISGKLRLEYFYVDKKARNTDSTKLRNGHYFI